MIKPKKSLDCGATNMTKATRSQSGYNTETPDSYLKALATQVKETSGGSKIFKPVTESGW
jgi:hypothetical protein